MAFQYSPTWNYHPIIIGDKRYDFDPSLEVPVPPNMEDHGKLFSKLLYLIITDCDDNRA
ncbi:MAG: hypothetical protein CM15mV94_200 [uncultured marine virus]|nr:MAG: hypothetical protein CM15mV94_200 [uncultured marine virus]